MTSFPVTWLRIDPLSDMCPLSWGLDRLPASHTPALGLRYSALALVGTPEGCSARWARANAISPGVWFLLLL